MSANYIYADKEINNITQKYTEAYRSNFAISTVKHCYEATLYEGCANVHIGFSPYSNERTFLSFWNSDNGNVILLDRISSGNDIHTKIDLSISTGDTCMVCLDSNNKRFISILNGESREINYTKVQNSDTWYAMTDTSYPCADSPANVGVNLGMKKFKNKMPIGFKQFIYGYDLYKFKCQQRITCSIKKTCSFISYIILILESK